VTCEIPPSILAVANVWNRIEKGSCSSSNTRATLEDTRQDYYQKKKKKKKKKTHSHKRKTAPNQPKKEIFKNGQLFYQKAAEAAATTTTTTRHQETCANGLHRKTGKTDKVEEGQKGSSSIRLAERHFFMGNKDAFPLGPAGDTCRS
jgi:hypothetical protein